MGRWHPASERKDGSQMKVTAKRTRIVRRELAAALFATALITGCGSTPAPSVQEGSETEATTSAQEATADAETTEEASTADEFPVTAEDFEQTGKLFEDSFGDTTYFCFIKNNSQETVGVDVNAVALDAEGNELDAHGGIIDALTPGETAILDYTFFGVAGVDHVDTEIVPHAPYGEPVLGDLDVSATTNERNVVLVTTNKGKRDAQDVCAYALFFDDAGNICDYDSKFLMDPDGLVKPGETLSAQLNCEGDFDHVEWYLRAGSDGGSTKVSDKVTDDDFTFQDYVYEIDTNDDSTSFLIVKSGADIPVGIKVFATAYDTDGKAIGAADKSIDVLGPGEQSLANFYYTSVKGIDHIDYSIQYDDAPSYNPVLSNLELGQSAAEKGVVLTIANKGNEAAESVQAFGLFFDDAGRLCGYDDAYVAIGDDRIEPGATATEELKPVPFNGFAKAECYLAGHGAEIV